MVPLKEDTEGHEQRHPDTHTQTEQISGQHIVEVVYSQDDARQSHQQGPEKQSPSDQGPAARQNDDRHSNSSGGMTGGKGVRIRFSVDCTPISSGSSPANGKLNDGGDDNRKSETHGNGDHDTLPGETMQPPEGKQTGNNHGGIGGVGNHRQSPTSPGSFGCLLQSAADGVVEPFEGSQNHGLDYSRYSSIWATNFMKITS